MRPINRFEPQLPVQSMKTYAIVAPKTTVPATCADVGCEHYLNGWRLRIDSLPADLVHAATHSGRKFERLDVAEGETWLVFEAGQPCFRAAEHVRVMQVDDDRFGVVAGDWRGYLGVIRKHTRAEDWVDDFAAHQDALATRLEQG